MKKTRFSLRSIFLLSGIALSSWAPMVPYIQRKLSLTESGLGIALFSSGLGALLSMPLAGYLIQRFGSRRMIVCSAITTFLMLPLLPFASSFFILSALLMLFGASTGTLNVSMNSHAVVVEKLSAQAMMSRFHCLFSFGGLIGASTLTFLLETGLHISTAAAMVSLLLFILLIANYKHLLPASQDIKKDNAPPLSFPSGKLLFLGIFCFFAFLSEGAMLDWSALFLTQAHQYDPAYAGIGYALFSFAMAFGRFVGDRLIHYFGEIKTMRISGCLTASGLLFVIYPFVSHLELFGFLMIGLGASNIVPILFRASGNVPDIQASTALTIVTTFGYTGILLGPAMIGLCAEATSLSFTFSLIALLLLIVGMNARIVRPQQEEALQRRAAEETKT